jgi:DNA-binding NarL/FixJ family response regulator
MSPLLREIVRRIIAREPDLEIVGDHEAADLAETVERDEPDFVIVGADGAAEQRIRTLVDSGSGLRALQVHSDGKESVLYELRPHRVSLGEISSDTLLRAIRAAPSWDAKA